MKLRSRGMTLLELMMALAVLGILVAIATPAFRNYTAASRVVSATNDVVTALAVARSEALKRSVVARVCPSVDLASCVATTDWSSGWIVYVDLDGDGAPATDADAEELIQVWTGVGGGTTLVGPSTGVSYDGLGMGVGAGAVLTVTPSPCTGPTISEITVTASGATTLKKNTCP